MAYKPKRKTVRTTAEIIALLNVELAAREIIDGSPDKWGYGAASNALDDTKREKLRLALEESHKARVARMYPDADPDTYIPKLWVLK